MIGRGIDQIAISPCAPALHESYVKDARDYVELAETRSGSIPRRVDPGYPWGAALELLASAAPDVRVINLETAITRSNDFDRGKGIHYRVSPENAAILSAAGVDVAVLGNNHVLDWGPRGLTDTLAALDALAIRSCGAGHDLVEASRPAIVAGRGDRRVAVFSIGCTDAGVPPWWAAGQDRPGVHVVTQLDAHELRRVRDLIEPWRRRDTVIVVSIHWGSNWDLDTPGVHQRFARGLIEDAGVHVVHGHSSHHVKGIEVYRGQPILYGCGDLVTDYEGIGGHEEYRGDLALLYFVSLDAGGALARLEMAPFRMHRFQLVRARPAEASWLAATLSRCGASLGTTAKLDGERLVLEW
jgi:poly-gamma-glutamate capsule biosynthesis protein CapA/YwtB (metallophosphatase superfamily)